MIDVCKTGRNGSVANSLGREADQMAGNRNHWPRTISLIWETMAMIDLCKTGSNGSAATSFGRKTDPVTGSKKHMAGKRFR